jgi:uncharacterized protein (TIGR02646 family)
MTPFTRGPAPAVLLEAAPAATESYIQRRKANAGAAFFWPQRNGESILPIVRAALGALTIEHCSYCDGFPIDAYSEKEVDHFKPKADFPSDAFDWVNLYLVCTGCNKAKLAEWNPLVIRPDEADYAFERFFIVDALTGELKPNPGATVDEQERATETIRVFNLRRSGLCSERRRIILSLNALHDANRPFRFL